MDYPLDQYFTPLKIAEKIFIKSGISKPNNCLDTTCGSGYLLQAASKVFGDIQCIGIDKDKKIINSLRRKRPNWLLSVANLLEPGSLKKTNVFSSTIECDLLTLNPPFSQNNKKHVNILYKNSQLKCSIAMAYILKSIETFQPKNGAIIIVPESLLFSEIDAIPRLALGKDFSIRTIMELDINTFYGTRARTSVIRLESTRKEIEQYSFINSDKKHLIKIHLIRGGLPVHKFVPSPTGKDFIHSTSIKSLTASTDKLQLPKTKQIMKGAVSGWVLLLPRVGIPNRKMLKCINLTKTIQLSDCVIALDFETEREAIEVETRIKTDFDSLLNLYRGTGARYVTILKLKSWLLDKFIISSAIVK